MAARLPVHALSIVVIRSSMMAIARAQPELDDGRRAVCQPHPAPTASRTASRESSTVPACLAS
jgi:hypothetical protein